MGFVRPYNLLKMPLLLPCISLRSGHFPSNVPCALLPGVTCIYTYFVAFLHIRLNV